MRPAALPGGNAPFLTRHHAHIGPSHTKSISRALPKSCRASSEAGGEDSTSTAAKSKATTTPPAADLSLKPSRRSALQLTTVGALHALASRSIFSADSAFAANAASGQTSTAMLARQLDARISEFTLTNGMRFIVSERRTVPVVSMHTYADVGAFDEVTGQTGLAHLLEHLAFKGTPRIGTTDFKKEAPLLDAMDNVFYSMLEAKSGNEVAKLQKRLDALLAEASALSVPNAYGALLSREGAVGLNASTTHDSTKYYCSMPANKLELWFALESERFLAPVFREVYSEKKVVLEERRLRVDNSPLGPFQEEFADRSLSNNYRRPVIGYERDIQRLGRKEVASFFAQHYGPSSLTVSIVGDVRPETVRKLAERYFGGWRSDGTPGAACNGGALEEPLPVPEGSRTLSVRSRAGPAVLRAYYRPCIRDIAATSALDVVNDTLTGSRSARLYKNLVLGGAALSLSSYSSFPAEKHPGQFVVYGIPAPGRSAEDLDSLIQREIGGLCESGPTATELRRYTKAARMGLLEVLQANSALAGALASYKVLSGDWREICNDLERLETLTASEVAATAQRYLQPENSFVGYVQV